MEQKTDQSIPMDTFEEPTAGPSQRAPTQRVPLLTRSAPAGNYRSVPTSGARPRQPGRPATRKVKQTILTYWDGYVIACQLVTLCAILMLVGHQLSGHLGIALNAVLFLLMVVVMIVEGCLRDGNSQYRMTQLYRGFVPGLATMSAVYIGLTVFATWWAGCFEDGKKWKDKMEEHVDACVWPACFKYIAIMSAINVLWGAAYGLWWQKKRKAAAERIYQHID